VDVFAGAFPSVVDGALLGTFFTFGGFADQADWDVALGGWFNEQDECLLALGVLGQGECFAVECFQGEVREWSGGGAPVVVDDVAA